MSSSFSAARSRAAEKAARLRVWQERKVVLCILHENAKRLLGVMLSACGCVETWLRTECTATTLEAGEPYASREITP